MTKGRTHVSTGSSDFADADDPSPETDSSGPQREGGTAEEQAKSPGPGSPSHRETSKLRILFLDDDPNRARAFLLRRPEAVWVQTAEDCISRLTESWDQVHLDHDLGGEVFVDSSRPDCGMEVVRWLCNETAARFQNTQFIIHTYNSEAGETMVSSLCDSKYQAVYRPFGVDLIEWLPDDEPEETEEDAPERPVKPSWSDWIGRLARRLRRGSRPLAEGSAEGETSRGEGKHEPASGDDPEHE